MENQLFQYDRGNRKRVFYADNRIEGRTKCVIFAATVMTVKLSVSAQLNDAYGHNSIAKTMSDQRKLFC